MVVTTGTRVKLAYEIWKPRMLLKTCIGQFHGRVTQPQMAVMTKGRAPL